MSEEARIYTMLIIFFVPVIMGSITFILVTIGLYKFWKSIFTYVMNLNNKDKDDSHR